MTKTHKTRKKFNGILGLFLAVLLLTACGKKGQDEFEKGKALYTAQDYKTAVTQFALAADKGHAEAQYIIGRCYAEGKGVEIRPSVRSWHLSTSHGMGIPFHD